MPANYPDLDRILNRRSRQIVLVVEDLYQPHNASSILRTCDAFGVQDLYIINTRYQFQFDPEKTAGTQRWVDRHEYCGESATRDCLRDLKRAGYTIAATSLRPGCVCLDDFEVPERLALCFGTEKQGLSETAHELADTFLRIPMYGLTQSFNVSVTAALSLQKLHDSLQPEGPRPLPASETAALRRRWQRQLQDLHSEQGEIPSHQLTT